MFFVSIFVDLFAVATVVPFLSDHAALLDVPPSMLGVVQAVYGFMQMLSTPVLGTMCDVYGARRILLLSVGGSSLAYGLLSWALYHHSLFGFIASRVLIGSIRQTMSVGSTYVVRAHRGGSDDEEVAVSKGLGKFQAAASLGFVIGPAVGGFVGDSFGVVYGALLAALVDAGNLILMWSVTRHETRVSSATLPATSPSTIAPSTVTPPQRNPLKLFLRVLWRRDSTSALLGSLYLASLAHITLQSTLSIIARRCFTLRGSTVGLLISAASALNVFMMSLVVPRLLSRAPHGADRVIAARAGRLTLLGYVVMLFAVLPQVSSVLPGTGEGTALCLFVVGLTLVSSSHGVADVIKRSCFATLFAPEMSGEVMSIVFSLDGANRVIAPLVAGLIIPAMPSIRSGETRGGGDDESAPQMISGPAALTVCVAAVAILLYDGWRSTTAPAGSTKLRKQE